jgi:hypothetical protein
VRREVHVVRRGLLQVERHSGARRAADLYHVVRVVILGTMLYDRGFHIFYAKKMTIFLKTNVMINFLA